MTDSGLRTEAKDAQCMSIDKPPAVQHGSCGLLSQESSLGWIDWTEGGCRGLTTELDALLRLGDAAGWTTCSLGRGNEADIAYLSPRAWQEVLDNDGFAQGWERGFHDAPHEGLHQGRGDSSSLFHLIQDLRE